MGVFRKPQDLLYIMATEIIEIDAPWAEKWTKNRSAILIRANCIMKGRSVGNDGKERGDGDRKKAV